MAIHVLGHWEIGYHAPISEQYYWTLMLRDFGIETLDMVPVSGIQCAEQQVELREWPSYAEFFEANDSLLRVFVEPRTERFNPDTTWLHDFEHPADDAVYVFGSAHYNPTLNHRRDADPVVTVKTVHDKGVLWADQAASIVLYDRSQKWL